MTVLTVKSLVAGYDKVAVINDIDFAVPANGKVALVGSNGAGKSTLVKAINGLVSSTSGSIVWDGQQLEGLPPATRTRAGIATVPEGRLLFPDCSVCDNLLAAATFPRARVDRDARLDSIMTLFPRLRERSRQRVGTLSGGEQQMVAIGRALMTKPRLLILDEPSIGLAPRVVGEIFDALTELTDTGLSLLLVEQNVELSLRFVDYGYVLQQGRITVAGSAAELAGDPQLRAAYFGAQ